MVHYIPTGSQLELASSSARVKCVSLLKAGVCFYIISLIAAPIASIALPFRVYIILYSTYIMYKSRVYVYIEM